MKPSLFLRIAATLAAVALLPACTQGAGKPEPSAPAASTEAIQPALIPVPATLQTGSGEFVVDAGTKLHADSDAARRVAERFNGFLAAAKWPELKPGESGASGGIRFEAVTTGTTSPEAYSLDVTPDGVVVRATDERGLFYGAVTLWQLLTQGEDGRVVLPAMHIDDTPRFSWRGLMLD
ncbi:beta-hexosaminidase, partial [Pseudoxanthomonas sangjuensis]|uniref:glycoside hydrolase family 20 zincin-like fold domain-containing protein n=1 Tax=Pseudoxanthomonas sangjuensis TaxID=1503750 RepID=UPI001478F383